MTSEGFHRAKHGGFLDPALLAEKRRLLTIFNCYPCRWSGCTVGLLANVEEDVFQSAALERVSTEAEG